MKCSAGTSLRERIPEAGLSGMCRDSCALLGHGDGSDRAGAGLSHTAWGFSFPAPLPAEGEAGRGHLQPWQYYIRVYFCQSQPSRWERGEPAPPGLRLFPEPKTPFV